MSPTSKHLLPQLSHAPGNNNALFIKITNNSGWQKKSETQKRFLDIMDKDQLLFPRGVNQLSHMHHCLQDNDQQRKKLTRDLTERTTRSPPCFRFRPVRYQSCSPRAWKNVVRTCAGCRTHGHRKRHKGRLCCKAMYYGESIHMPFSTEQEGTIGVTGINEQAAMRTSFTDPLRIQLLLHKRDQEVHPSPDTQRRRRVIVFAIPTQDIFIFCDARSPLLPTSKLRLLAYSQTNSLPTTPSQKIGPSPYAFDDHRGGFEV